MTSLGSPESAVHVVTVWPLAPAAEGLGAEDILREMAAYVDRVRALDAGSTCTLGACELDIGSLSFQFTGDTAHQYEDAAWLAGPLGPGSPVTAATAAIIAVRRRGLALALDLVVETEEVAAVIALKKALFDPKVKVLVGEADLHRLPAAQFDVQLEKVPGRIAPLANLGAAPDGLAADTLRSEFDRLVPELENPNQATFIPAGNARLYDAFLDGAREQSVEAGARSQSRADFLALTFKDTAVRYEPRYAPHSVPAEANALEGMTVAVRDRDVVVLGLDAYSRYLGGRDASMLVAVAQARCAEAYCLRTVSAVDTLHEQAPNLQAESDEPDDQPDSDRLSAEGHILERRLVSIARAKAYLDSVVGEVASLAAAESGSPERSVLAAVVEQTGLARVHAHARQVCDDTLTSADIDQRIHQLRVDAHQQRALRELVDGGSTVKLVAIVFAIVSIVIATFSLWVALLGAPGSGADQAYLRPAGLVIGLLGCAALGGLGVWWLSVGRNEAGQRTASQPAGTPLGRRMRWAVVLLVCATALSLAGALASSGVRLADGDDLWEKLALIAAAGMFAVSIGMLATWFRRENRQR